MLLRMTTLIGLMLACVGCGPQVIYDSSVTVSNNDIKPILFGPFKKEAKVTVRAETNGPPVSVYVHPEDQTEHVDYAISYGKEPSVLAGSNSVESATYDVAVPAETEIVVRLQGTSQEDSQVSLKITK